MLTGRHFAGEEHRSGCPGESVRGRSRCRVACRGGDVAGVGGADRLSAQVAAVFADTYRGPWIYEPGAAFADLAATVGDGADCIDGVGQSCGDRRGRFR